MGTASPTSHGSPQNGGSSSASAPPCSTIRGTAVPGPVPRPAVARRSRTVRLISRTRLSRAGRARCRRPSGRQGSTGAGGGRRVGGRGRGGGRAGRWSVAGRCPPEHPFRGLGRAGHAVGGAGVVLSVGAGPVLGGVGVHPHLPVALGLHAVVPAAQARQVRGDGEAAGGGVGVVERDDVVEVAGLRRGGAPGEAAVLVPGPGQGGEGRGRRVAEHGRVGCSDARGRGCLGARSHQLGAVGCRRTHCGARSACTTRCARWAWRWCRRSRRWPGSSGRLVSPAVSRGRSRARRGAGSSTPPRPRAGSWRPPPS